MPRLPSAPVSRAASFRSPCLRGTPNYLPNAHNLRSLIDALETFSDSETVSIGATHNWLTPALNLDGYVLPFIRHTHSGALHGPLQSGGLAP